MATLEKIRSRSVLLVSVIFVALFLFIITIVDNPMGLVQDHTTVAKVKGDKIDYEKYQGLIMESLMNREFDNLGITVTDAEITEAMVGEKAAMMTAYRFQQTHNGVTPEEFYSYMTDPDSYGIPAEQVQAMEADWMNFENEVEQMLKSQKLYSLLVGTIKANKVDAKAMFDEGNTTYTIVSVGKSLYSQPDTLTDEDIKAYYANHRADYAMSTSTSSPRRPTATPLSTLPRWQWPTSLRNPPWKVSQATPHSLSTTSLPTPTNSPQSASPPSPNSSKAQPSTVST